MKSVLQVIKSRRSVRAYEEREIPREILEDLIDCGRLAPSGYNRQPWVFVVVTERERRHALAELCQWGRFLREAKAAILIFYEKDAETGLEDACAAAENIIIAAWAYGLGTCWINSHRKAHSEAVKRLVHCPENLELAVILAVGYPKEIPHAPWKKKLAEVLRWEDCLGSGD
ncbi:MAG: nitroreductase family protein [Candidatus Caldatribacterium sp.]|uniref:nitroreductase family protein n=1 Tax=Candidatus Caldatribacterium sp. TaxID=2282143 RepID=UPI00299AAFF8|nr:nitroreductase family protein [Candidatus Caldatribacterium sp.]MCX7730603.1 nitroreductase family protein [Candidatus Caldatribacterium sp.]MDW8081869.1 nitroreductase family protein [Candidatus Calescibacterium sp.]